MRLPHFDDFLDCCMLLHEGALLRLTGMVSRNKLFFGIKEAAFFQNPD